MTRAISEITILVVQRAAKCYTLEDPRVDPQFWETLYGQASDDEQDVGMIDWGAFHDYEDA